MSSRASVALKLLFSVWLVFHVLVVLVMPNGMSYPGRVLGNWIYPYAAALGLNVSWNFFSPDPAHTMYLKFTIYQDETAGSGQEPLVISMPEEQDRGVWDLGRRRELYSMRYFLLDPRRIEVALGPWLCRTHAGASLIRIEHVIESIPSLDEASLFAQSTLGELSRPYGSLDREYSCSQVNDEVGL